MFDLCVLTDYIYVQDVSFFCQILGHSSVVQDEETLEIHNTDWTKKFQGKAQLMLKPETTEEVSAILRHCNERKLAIVP